MVISRSPAVSQAVSGLVCFGGKCLPLEEHIKVLGVVVDRCRLRFDYYAAAVAQQMSKFVSALRRVAGNLDSHGILTLYMVLIRPCMEYGALTWISSAVSNTLMISRTCDATRR